MSISSAKCCFPPSGQRAVGAPLQAGDHSRTDQGTRAGRTAWQKEVRAGVRANDRSQSPAPEAPAGPPLPAAFKRTPPGGCDTEEGRLQILCGGGSPCPPPPTQIRPSGCRARTNAYV
ncbi:unnamed protein product [Lota lota]